MNALASRIYEWSIALLVLATAWLGTAVLVHATLAPTLSVRWALVAAWLAAASFAGTVVAFVLHLVDEFRASLRGGTRP